MRKYTIAVAGTGYVGLSLAVLLAQHNKVYAVDIVPEKVELINSKKSPIQDEYIEKYLAEKELDLTATLDAKLAYACNYGGVWFEQGRTPVQQPIGQEQAGGEWLPAAAHLAGRSKPVSEGSAAVRGDKDNGTDKC